MRSVIAAALCAVGLAAFAEEPEISAVSEEGFLDLTVGDRIVADEETLVVDPAWGKVKTATVTIDGESSERTYTSASNDTWQTTTLTPGRYTLALSAGTDNETAAFWKVGDDWVVFDSSNITAVVTFEAGKTYLFFGTNTADGVTLKVEDGAKFAYDKGAPAGFLGGTVDLPKRYEQKTVEGGLYQIVEKIKGCADNPWEVGEGVTAYTNGTELVIGGAGTVGALSGVDGLKDLLAGLTAINVTSNGVTGAEAQAFADVGTDGGSVMLTLPDGWQGELPDDRGNWYGALIDMEKFVVPLAVKNVTFRQRYPWNGKVDIGFGVRGPAGEKSVVITVCDGADKVTNFTAAVTIPADGVLATNLVWDAETAGLAANFKSDDVTVEVKIDESDIAAKSEAGTVDLRDDVPLAKGAVTVASVGYSDTAWGTEPEAKVTLGWTNETTGATGVIATGLEREGAVEVDLPKQNGGYKLTHSTGGLTSIMKFTVTGYPLGCETNPWKVGPEEDPERTVAWTNGNGNVYFKPPRSAVTRTGLETVTNAMGGADFTAKLVSEDGTATNNIMMVLGASGTVYDTIADALAADEASCTLFEVGGYFVSYSGGEGASGTMATDTFVPTVPTNLTANAFTWDGYTFAGWTTNGSDEVAYADRASGVDFAQPGETLALTAKWTANDYAISYAMDDGTPFGAWAAGYTAPTEFSVTNNVTLPVKANVDEANFLFNAWTNAEGVVFTTTDGLLVDLAVYADVTRLWSVTLPTVAHATCAVSTNGVPLAAGKKVVDGATVTFTLTPDAGYVLEGPSVYTATATGNGVTVKTDDAKIKKIVAVEIRPAEHATFVAEVADGGSYVAFDANPTNLIEGMVFRVTVTPDEDYVFNVAPEGWELADGKVSRAFTVGDADLVVTIPAPRRSTVILHPEGDGGVFVRPTKATVYEGVTLDETGVVAGSVTVKLGKPNKKGEMTVSATVKTLADKQTYTFKPETKKVSAFVDGPLVLTLVGSNTKSKAHTFALAIEGDSLTGTFDACTVDGARNVFKVSKDPKRDRLAPFVGYWTLAFGTATSVDATCRVQVSKNGSVHIHGRLADGTLISCHPKAEVGAGWIAAPATVRKVVKGQVKTFAFRVAFDEATQTVTAVNVAPVVVADRKTLAVVSETPVTAVVCGKPKLTKDAVKAMTFGAEGREVPVKSSVKINATRGELTGTLTWKTPNAKGRMVSETGKVYGIDIDGVLYGSVFFSKTGETRPLVVGD